MSYTVEVRTTSGGWTTLWDFDNSFPTIAAAERAISEHMEDADAPPMSRDDFRITEIP